MKKTEMVEDSITDPDDDLRPEYRFDYSKAQPNRFADRIAKTHVVITLDADVSEVFADSESVNRVLRALIAVMPDVKRPEPSR